MGLLWNQSPQQYGYRNTWGFLHTVFECGSTIVLAQQKSAMQATFIETLISNDSILLFKENQMTITENS